MKCKSWSNKINNFVVRRLKSIKINGQQQQQQQQFVTTCSTMPAMPKEKATAVALSESNFTELKLKELATSAAVVAATATVAAMASTATAAAANSRLPATPQRSSTCGCGAASEIVIGGSSATNRNKYLTNGHTSPLAAAVAAHNATASPERNATCCRIANNNTHNGNSNSNSNGGQLETPAVTNTAAVTPPKKTSKDFIFGKYIGEGSFSIVYLAVDVNTKREYAIKVCEKRHILREHKQEYIRREREVMNMLTNVPGFVNLSCTFQDNRSLYFVMTYAKNGDLLPYINKVGSFDVECTRHYAAELVLACEQMHRRNVVHRDLKPENILLDEDMHTLIADFGSAKILTPEDRAANAAARQYAIGVTDENEDTNDDDYDDDDDTTGSDEVDSSSRNSRYQRKRKGSFVGTAQYVSPEVLQNGPITPAADLWALGCIVYQMISGLPPFRASSDYIIFKEIVACKLDFPEGFDKDAADLVRQLLKVNPEERLGAQDNNSNGHYDSIRSHRFFAGVDFDSVRQQTPPPIYPYLPGVSKNEDLRSAYRVPEYLEPGLDKRQLNRLLAMELGTAFECELLQSDPSDGGAVKEIEQKTVKKNIFDVSYAEKQKRLEQQKSDKWHVFADNEVILKKGYVNKRKGLFARKRMLLLTTGPRLIYIDPVQMIKKGEIPWSSELRVEAKNFKIFFVHTPNRTYYLEDPEGYSLEWVEAIENMRKLSYKDQTSTNNCTSATAAVKTSSN